MGLRIEAGNALGRCDPKIVELIFGNASYTIVDKSVRRVETFKYKTVLTLTDNLINTEAVASDPDSTVVGLENIGNVFLDTGRRVVQLEWP